MAECFLDIFHLFGPPKVLITNNGTEFKGAVAILAQKLGIQIRHGRPHHPQTTGKVSKLTCTCTYMYVTDLLQNTQHIVLHLTSLSNVSHMCQTVLTLLNDFFW